MGRVVRSVLISVFLAGGIGFFTAGAVLYKTAIDLDPSAFFLGRPIQSILDLLGAPARPLVGPFWIGVSLLTVLVLVLVTFRRALRGGQQPTDPGRRRILSAAATGAALGATGLAAALAFARAWFGIGNGGRGWGPIFTHIFAEKVPRTHPAYPERWRGARVKSYRTLGRTAWRISDVVLGSGRIGGEKGADLVRQALDRGVNYVDTSPDYSATGSELAVGEGVRGKRDQVFLATKFCTPRGHLGPRASVSEYKRVVEESLRRLATDYVDLVHIHSCDEVERIRSETCHEAFDRLKQEGKVRFLGFSSHTPNLVQVADAAIASGRFDVMMLAYHHGIWPSIGEVIHRARREQDMGIVAMKTLKGAKHRGLMDFQRHAEAYSQAALKWTLTNPDVSAAIISFFEYQHLDEYLYISGQKQDPQDLALLGEYDRRIAGTYCAPHCGTCLASCPAGVPVADVLRHRMYFEDYHHEKEAMRLYAALETNAEVCLGCDAPCAGSCPLEINIQRRTVAAHEMLTLQAIGDSV